MTVTNTARTPGPVELVPITGLPMIVPGQDLAALIADALDRAGVTPAAGDVLVVCQKVVSKAEGRIVRLADVEPRAEAREFADKFAKDSALVELAMAEAREILRRERGHLITATGPGWICANSGLDRSNQNADGEVTLLPVDADASAARLREQLADRFGVRLGVIVSDTFGRPWRLGQLDVAIGAAGVAVLDDHAGCLDLAGRPLEHTQIAVGDQLAAAAGLLAGKADGVPAVLVRGLGLAEPGADDEGATRLLRPPEDDLFR